MPGPQRSVGGKVLPKENKSVQVKAELKREENKEKKCKRDRQKDRRKQRSRQREGLGTEKRRRKGQKDRKGRGWQVIKKGLCPCVTCLYDVPPLGCFLYLLIKVSFCRRWLSRLPRCALSKPHLREQSVQLQFRAPPTQGNLARTTDPGSSRPGTRPPFPDARFFVDKQ